jgi:ATP-dependent Lhr-like helicase
MLITLAWEEEHYQPLAFNCSDYGLAIQSLKKVPDVTQVLQKKALLHRLDNWISQSQLAKRSFRSVATIAGLIERQLPGKRKTLKQVTFSSDLIYDVLLKYEPEHILLTATKQDTLDSLISLTRLEKHLDAMKDNLIVHETGLPSPLSIPLLTTANQENIQGEALTALLDRLAH